MRHSTFPRLMGRVTVRVFVKGLATAATAAVLAGCSNSIERFQSAYNNPSDADPVYTASVPKPARKPAVRYRAPVSAPSYDAASDDTISESPVTRSPVARAPVAPAVPKYDYAQAYNKPYKAPVYKQPAYKAPQAPSYDVNEPDVAVDDTPVTARRVQPAPVARASNGTVTVGPGQTIYSIARDNGVDPMQLAAANNMKAPYVVWSGQKLHMPTGAEPAPVRQTASAKPRYSQPVFDNTSDDADAAPAPAPVKTAARPVSSKGTTHTVAGGETLYSLGRTYGVSPFVIADANGLPHDKGLHIGQKLTIPGAKAVKSQPAANQDMAQADDGADAVQQPAVKPTKRKAPLSLAADEEQQADAAPADDSMQVPQKAASGSKPKNLATEKPVPAQTQMAASPAGGNFNLRWPLRGKVISEFGPKANGLKNEGINIAVPEGTSIRAAEGGVVAYAGNELKGYGNLVLIRHPGGFVTAYAHAKELLVKRGDNVNKGDVIAKAGQTGAVSSPQLHFEVRKGATALDPLKFMSSATAMN
ncbi:MAG: peptidoglycan DD-metalloendopeptidase family protein [Hyphomicrobiales bacterium]